MTELRPPRLLLGSGGRTTSRRSRRCGRAALAFAFDELGLPEIVSFTTVANDRSRRVMERLGLTRDPADDFDHPRLAPDDPLRPHILYRLSRAAWGEAR